MINQSRAVHPKRAIRNPLLELRPWIFDLIFGDFGGPFWLVFTSWKPSGARHSILEGLTELSGSRESAAAHLGPNFRPFRQKCEGFSKFCNFTFKKSPFQGLDFLYNNFLFLVSGVAPFQRPPRRFNREDFSVTHATFTCQFGAMMLHSGHSRCCG